jgi:hypothetical protein
MWFLPWPSRTKHLNMAIIKMLSIFFSNLMLSIYFYIGQFLHILNIFESILWVAYIYFFHMLDIWTLSELMCWISNIFSNWKKYIYTCVYTKYISKGISKCLDLKFLITSDGVYMYGVCFWLDLFIVNLSVYPVVVKYWLNNLIWWLWCPVNLL